MQKNKASLWVVAAYESDSGANPGLPVTGDAANITANIYIDSGSAAATNDVNPTEREDGLYYFNMTAAETNGDCLMLTPQSSTANVSVTAISPVIYTTPPNFNTLTIANSEVNANTKRFNGTVITGTGSSSDKFGV